MTKKEIITEIKKKIWFYSYKTRIFEELISLDFDVVYMRARRDTSRGKASGCMEVLIQILGESLDYEYEDSQRKAIDDIIRSNHSIPELLILAGCDGEELYSNYFK